MLLPSGGGADHGTSCHLRGRTYFTGEGCRAEVIDLLPTLQTGTSEGGLWGVGYADKQDATQFTTVLSMQSYF